MKRIFLYFSFIAFLFCGKRLCAQQKKIDSLKTLININKNDTVVAWAYLTLAEIYYTTNPDTVIPVCETAISFIEKTIDNHNQFEKKRLLVYKAAALTNIGVIHYGKGDMEKGLDFLKQGLKIQEEIDAKAEVATAYNNIGAIYFSQGQLEIALDYFLQGLKIQQVIKDKKGQGYSLNNIANIYGMLAQTQKCLDYHYKALKINEEMGNKSATSSSLNNIAAIYMRVGQLEKALEYNFMSLKIRKETSDKLGICISTGNIGAVYNKIGKLDSALFYYNESLKRSEEIGNKNGIANALNNIGGIHDRRNQLNEALDFYEKGLRIYVEMTDTPKVSNSLGNIGGIYMKQKQNQKALEYISKALNMSVKGKNIEGIRNSYMLLTRVDSAMGNSVAALDHYKKYIIYRDSITSTAERKAAIRKQVQYEYDKKTAATKLEQEKLDFVHQEQIKQHQLTNTIYLVAIIALVMTLLALLLLFNRSRLKQKNKHQQLINRQQKELAVAIMETQEQERKRIAEDLHDSLGHLLSTAKLNLQTLAPGQKQVESSLQLLNQASEEIRSITFNLMPKALEEEGLVSALNELSAKITNAGAVKVNLLIHDFEKFILDKQSQFNIYRIVQEAVNNILKHAEAKEINIQLVGQPDHFTIMIEDDGKGFDTTAKKGGRGLRNIVTRSLWLNGNINIDSTPGKGTTITTEIPK